LQDGEGSATSSSKNASVPDSELSGSSTMQNGHSQSIKTEDLSLCTVGDKQKSKKHKKDKSRHAERTDNSVQAVVEPDASAVTTDSLSKSEKKKKKRKHQEDVVNADVNTVCENSDKNAAAAKDIGHKDKKSAKKRKHDSDVQKSGENGDVRDDSCKRVKTSERNTSLYNFRFIITILTVVVVVEDDEEKEQ